MSSITISVNRNLDDANATALAGSISSSTASAIVTGVGTAFNATNTPVGCPIYSGATYLGNVLSIQSATQLTLTANALATVSGATNGFAYLNLALNNQEIVTITNGATLTVNSDNFYSQQAAYPYYYSVSNGTLNFDGTTVWWIPFDASSGNVPALGTQGTDDVTVSGGNVGEFLGVYTALGTVRVVPGNAMPVTGFVKLRRKTGTINDNDVLTFTGGATATVNSATGGQRGWLEFHMASNGNFQAENGIQTTYQGVVNFNGDWFELGTATGVAGMTLQHYAGDYCPAVQIETASGSGVYEWYCAVDSTTNMDTGHRIFTCGSTGLITFGGSTWGKLPPSGAKIQVPNICMRSAYSNASQLTTAVAPRERPHFRGGGPFTMNKAIFAGHAGRPEKQAFYATYINSAILDGVSNAEGAATITEQLILSNCGIGVFNTTSPGVFIRESSSVSISNCTFYRGTRSAALSINNCKNITLSNNLYVYAANAPSVALNYCSNITANNEMLIGSAANAFSLSLTACSNFTYTNTKISSRLHPTLPSLAAGNSSAINLTACSDGVFIGMDYVPGYPYWPLFDFVTMSNNCTRVHFRDIGTPSAPFTAQGPTVASARAFISVGGISDCHMSKVYVVPGAGYSTSIPVGSANGSGNDFYVSESGNPLSYAAAPYAATYCSGIGQRVIGAAGTPGAGGGLRVPMFLDVLTSETTLSLYINTGSEKFSGSVLDANAYTEDSGGPLIRNGALAMPTAGNQITWTWNYAILGLTSFANTTPAISGTNIANFTLTYDLDKGSGFSGTFKALTAANLFAETGISPTGVRLRVRALVNTSNATNTLTRIHIYGVTSAVACAANPYPYNNPPVTVINGLSSSVYSIFRVSDGKRLETRTGSASVTLIPDWYANTSVMLRVRKPGYDAIDLGFTLTERVASVPVSQLDNTIPDTNPGAKAITITNHGASPVTWNSKTWSITVTVTDGSSAATIAQYLSWQTAQDSYNLLSGFHNTALPVMVIPVGTGYETARGTLYGSAGASLKGVRVVDGSGNEVPGFARMQSDDGTYYSPAASYTLTVSNIVTDSRILVRRTDTLAVIANQAVTTGTFTYSYVHTSDIPIEIVVRKATASPYYQEWRTTTTLTNSNNSQTANQLSDS